MAAFPHYRKLFSSAETARSWIRFWGSRARVTSKRTSRERSTLNRERIRRPSLSRRCSLRRSNRSGSLPALVFISGYSYLAILNLAVLGPHDAQPKRPQGKQPWKHGAVGGAFGSEPGGRCSERPNHKQGALGSFRAGAGGDRAPRRADHG